MTNETIDSLVALAAQVVESARNRGADVAEATARQGSHLSTKVRLREPELVEEAGSRSVGVRVMIGQQVAVSYTSDLTKDGVERLVEDALELARLSQPDPYAGPPDPSLLSKPEQHPDLAMFDPEMGALGAGDALARAREGEEAAFAFDERIVNSEGASFTRAAGASAIVTSGGFSGGY